MGKSTRARHALLAGIFLAGPIGLIDCAGGADNRDFSKDSGTTGDPDASTGGDGGSDGSGGSGTGGANAGGGGANGGGGGAPAGGCERSADCDDGNLCNGAEICTVEGVCERGQRADDGTTCTGTPREGGTGSFLCHAGNCAESVCGDGIVDANLEEDCDDGNPDPSDGCEVTCKFSCAAPADCDDQNLCNGTETCNSTSHRCEAGTEAARGTSCGTAMVCRTGECIPEGCGDGTPAGTEECDDGDDQDGNGCNNDCTWTCETNEECNDGSVCTGTEICDAAAHVCRSGAALDCDDSDDCTTNGCDPELGCQYPLIDADTDGHAAESLGACGDDCADDDATIYGGAEELCDNKDNNCNGQRDETAPRWYVDCDGDGYAPLDAVTVQQCAEPPPPSTCPAGTAALWTNRVPADIGTRDCWDASALAYPGATAWQTIALSGRNAIVDFDYNCDEDEERYYKETSVSSADSCSSGIILPPIPGPIIPGPIIQPNAVPIFNLCYGRDGWTGSQAAACGSTGSSFNECYYEDCSRILIGCTAGCRRRTITTRTQSCH